MPVVEFFDCLKLEQIILFLNGYLSGVASQGGLSPPIDWKGSDSHAVAWEPQFIAKCGCLAIDEDRLLTGAPIWLILIVLSNTWFFKKLGAKRLRRG